MTSAAVRRLVILGAGEHARVVADAAAATAGAWDEIALVDAAGEAGLLAAIEASPIEDRPMLVLGFGTLSGREAAVTRFGELADWASIIHPAAWISPSAGIGPGAVVLAGAVLNAGASVGAHAIVNTGAIVEHDVQVGAFAHVAPGAVIGGGARIGERAMVGLRAAIRDHVAIGRDATVGMGAVVIRDVPAGSTVIGVPAQERMARG
jgi:sugar O-acyltransferase (sialic acid O-acetyltransferase NeuD family)